MQRGKAGFVEMDRKEKKWKFKLKGKCEEERRAVLKCWNEEEREKVKFWIKKKMQRGKTGGVEMLKLAGKRKSESLN